MTEKKRGKQNKKMIQHHNLNWDTQVTKSGVLQNTRMQTAMYSTEEEMYSTEEETLLYGNRVLIVLAVLKFVSLI